VTQHLADLAGEPRADRLDHEAIAIRIDREDPLERMVLLRVGLDVAQEAADLLDLLGQERAADVAIPAGSPAAVRRQPGLRGGGRRRAPAPGSSGRRDR
jgi:hypothetical protein